MSTAGALGSLGSDLAFSVSFGIATELLDAANEAQLSEEELIAIVLALSVVLAAMPSSFRAVRREIAKVRSIEKVDTAASTAVDAEASGILEFVTLLLRMAQRISISICVQLLSSNVRSRQPLRAVRVVSLLAVSIFFLFLESTSGVGQSHSGR
jgi:hypothetical protein|tara:strand:+ start:1274 stop:1735 length:462 start_codon:yes stop_codon:yes gene_type:complete